MLDSFSAGWVLGLDTNLNWRVVGTDEKIQHASGGQLTSPFEAIALLGKFKPLVGVGLSKCGKGAAAKERYAYLTGVLHATVGPDRIVLLAEGEAAISVANRVLAEVT